MKKIIRLILAGSVLLTLLTGCGTKTESDASSQQPTNEVATQKQENSQTEQTNAAPSLSGDIIIDGSSTVFPITEAVAEEFRKLHPQVNVPIGVSGTGGGFKKFALGEIDMNDASRPIKDGEKEDAKANGIEFIDLEIAYDGLSIVVNSANDWVESMTIEELHTIWGPESTVKKWSDVRPEWPNETIKLYAPGTDSGTFDYFTEAVNGKSGAVRTDFTPSEDDNVLVQGIAGDKYALGFFGYSYYEENKDVLKALQIDGGNGPVGPTFETIKNGSYAPLSRPLFLYVNKESLKQEHVKEFLRFYLGEGTKVIKDVGYVELEQADYTKQLDLLK
ncbi:PstS family phosphate ABC transporter substrate-binding protein [Cellulosilyticum sp. I15G10I2]|uniref:PstS family phosphate ABC transporter substrate-binding protein n=1 Tax=Cellulosilyticum sp. I15G10I2 TaxID=1892843 RepID=UPI00085C6F4A|nr:PstS family phosphate ABC transporter substrate-binding protein [Cellulosilyticum sp. I15G10I2]